MTVVLLLVAYLIGSLPLGYALVRWTSGRDPRLTSAYNLGLENTLTLLGWRAGLLTFAADLLKGGVAVGLTWVLGDGEVAWAGLMVYLGHLFPLPLARGAQHWRGRGAGVLAGILLALAVLGWPWGAVVLTCVLALGTVLLTRFLVLLPLLLALALGLASWLWPELAPARLPLTLLLLLALWRTKENLGRILEGTEPRLGQPLPLPSERQVVCAFMIHPLTIEDLFQSPRFAWMKPLVARGLVPAAWVEWLATWFRPMKNGELRGITTADGRDIRVYLISAPLLPHQIVGMPQLATRRAIQAARLAQELGCTVFGLGAYWSVVGEKGRLVQETVPGIEVTNGGAYTAGTVKAAIPGILAHYAQTGRDLSQSTAAVVGANGVVAFGIARQIAPLVGRLILVGRNLERLEKSAASLRANLERRGKVPQIDLEVTPDRLIEADLIFSATSDPQPVILPQHIKPGTWIYDEGVPPDVHPDVQQIPGVRVIPGGVVRPPGKMLGRLNLHFGQGTVPACLAETMILATERAYDRKSLGGETRSENIQFFVDRADALGFKVVD
jgi:acyl-phosphate glycerol 3-phosphate acyltransferase